MEKKKNDINGLYSLNNIIIDDLKCRLDNNTFWKQQIQKLEASKISLHLAIFTEPYLSYLIEGKKTIESRFSVNRVAPYKKIDNGDIVLLKLSSGPIIGICIAEQTWFYKLDQKSWEEINNEFFYKIYVFDQQFWDNKKKSCFASLIKFNNTIQIIPPINIVKKDRRGWVIIKSRNPHITLDSFNYGDKDG